jgi:hypothetical protein
MLTKIKVSCVLKEIQRGKTGLPDSLNYQTIRACQKYIKSIKIGKNNMIYIPGFPIIWGNVFPEKVNENPAEPNETQQNWETLLPSLNRLTYI